MNSTDWKAAEQAGRDITSAMAESMGVLTALYDNGMIPPLALPRVALIVAKYRSALPLAQQAIKNVEAFAAARSA